MLLSLANLGFSAALGVKHARGGRLGVKHAGNSARVGIKRAISHSEDIEKTAGEVGKVAGQVAKYAGMGAGIAAATGIGEPVAAGLAGIAGLAKGVETGAGYVGSAAEGIGRVRRALS